MPAQQCHHVVNPRPTAESGDDPQFRKIHGDLVEMTRMAEIVRPIGGVVHVGVDAHWNIELHAFRI